MRFLLWCHFVDGNDA